MMLNGFPLLPESEMNRIPTPALICFPDIMAENIRRMVEIAGNADRLWVHIKTVKSPDVMRRLFDAGITHFKCATFAEAEMAGACGAANVLWAYPLAGPNIPLFLELKRRFPCTHWLALADEANQIRALGRALQQNGTEADLLIDVDLGMHRTGVSPEKLSALCALALKMPGIRLAGVHLYDGHIHLSSRTERQSAVDEEHARLDPILSFLRGQGVPLKLEIWGGTPTFPCHSRYSRASLSPGTCVLHDAGYSRSFPDLPFRPAALVITRVISHPGADMFTLDLGYKGIASDPKQPRAELPGYEDAETVVQSEEHWTLRLPGKCALPPIGQALYAVPAHICPTVNLYPCYLVAQKGKITAEWPISARNRRVSPLAAP